MINTTKKSMKIEKFKICPYGPLRIGVEVADGGNTKLGVPWRCAGNDGGAVAMDRDNGVGPLGFEKFRKFLELSDFLRISNFFISFFKKKFTFGFQKGAISRKFFLGIFQFFLVLFEAFPVKFAI